MRKSVLIAAGLLLSAQGAPAQEPMRVTEAEGLCIKILNAQDCARAIEARQIPLSKVHVRRDSVALYLRLTNGKIVRVVDDSTTGFSYVGTCATLGYYVLSVQYDEGSAIRLVNERTGWTVIIDDLPIVSPDRRHVVTATQAMERYNPERLVVWRVEHDTLRREWGFVLNYWVPDEVRWLSNRSFEFAHIQLGINDAVRTAVDTAEIDSTGHWTTRLGPCCLTCA